MSRDPSGIYTVPAGTDGIPDTTIESAKYNGFVHDVEQDLNLPRPIVAGGTGANSASQARDNLDAEVAMQTVADYATHVFEAGSFKSAVGAFNSPDGTGAATNSYVGTAQVSDANNIVIQAYSIATGGSTWTRRRVAGTWGAWTTGRASIYAAPLDVIGYSGIQVNGNFDIWQELPNGVSGQTTFTGFRVADVYTFGSNVAAGNGTWSFQPTQIGGNMGRTIAITSTTPPGSLNNAADRIALSTVIEHTRMYRLQWGVSTARPLTVAFLLYVPMSGRSGIIYVAARNGATDRSYVVPCAFTSGLNYWAVTIPGDTAGNWAAVNGIGMHINITLGCGSQFRAPSDFGWHAGNFFSGPQQTTMLTTANDGLHIGHFIAVPGSEAPSSPNLINAARELSVELPLVQRYYRKSYNLNTVPGTGGDMPGIIKRTVVGYSTTQVGPYGHSVEFGTTMRGTPAIKIYHINTGTQNSALVWGNGAANATITPIINHAAENGFGFGGTGTGFVQYWTYEAMFHYTADARL